MSDYDFNASPIPAPLTEEQWEILGDELLAERRAERAQAAEDEAERLAKLEIDRAAILALPDAGLLMAMQLQFARWDAASDDVAEWGWHSRFEVPDDPGIEAWRRRATLQYQRLRLIADEVNRRGIGPASPAPGPEDTVVVVDCMPSDFFNDVVLGDADLHEADPRR